MAPKVVLIGPPGSGKSTIGQALATILGLPFADTDDAVEAEAGVPIADVFVQHGEQHFRKLERAAIQQALARHTGVLALGGGAVTNPDTRSELNGHLVVFLDVTLAEAAHRVGFDTSRPLLLGNVRGQLKALMDARRPLYEQVAIHTVHSSTGTPEEIATRILALLEPS